MAKGRLLGVLALVLLFVQGADGALAQGAPTAPEKRVALVIGNAAYKDAPLKNPVNDARAMAAALQKLGFEVVKRENATQKDMNRAISEFDRRLAGGGVGLFYYAGHGMQVRGRNYLLPVDAEISSEASVRNESIDVDQVLDAIGSAKDALSMVILDACRNNPFERRFRSSVGNGLAQVEAPKGALIAYATAPGKVAADGDGANGLYTAELLRAMDEPGLRVEDVFKRVRARVSSATADLQVPWEASSLVGDFYFKRGDNPAVELAFWQAIQTSGDPGDFRGYLDKYPNGQFAVIARNRLRAIDGAVQKADLDRRQAEELAAQRQADEQRQSRDRELAQQAEARRTATLEEERKRADAERQAREQAAQRRDDERRAVEARAPTAATPSPQLAMAVPPPAALMGRWRGGRDEGWVIEATVEGRRLAGVATCVPTTLAYRFSTEIGAAGEFAVWADRVGTSVVGGPPTLRIEGVFPQMRVFQTTGRATCVGEQVVLAHGSDGEASGQSSGRPAQVALAIPRPETLEGAWRGEGPSWQLQGSVRGRDFSGTMTCLGVDYRITAAIDTGAPTETWMTRVGIAGGPNNVQALVPNIRVSIAFPTVQVLTSVATGGNACGGETLTLKRP
jgi:hypothetical protein